MSSLELAISLATAAHTGQVDKAGKPYILHPLRVVLAVRGDAERMAAVLHDVVEDTPITLEQLRELGFPEEVVAAVDALTKQPGEDYFDFVERAGMNDVARPVKLADIVDNMDGSRIASPTANDEERIRWRYRPARKLLEAIARSRGDRTPAAPTILPLRSAVSTTELRRECPGDGPIYACDFYVAGAERGREEAAGLRIGRILNVDHHAPIPRMMARETSTKLAVAHIRTHGPVEPTARVVINHTDCDSVLSSAIMMGLLEPDEAFVTASVRADHTGEEDPIADLLQALDEARTGDRTDDHFIESLRNLQLLRAGQPPEPAAQRAVAARRVRRALAQQLVHAGKVRLEGPIALGVLDDEIDGALFLPLLPEAKAVMLVSDHPERLGHHTVKLRLGRAAPDGFSLHDLGLSAFDPAFGGRWNAGSNKRGGGTQVTPELYADEVKRRIVHRLVNGTA